MQTDNILTAIDTSLTQNADWPELIPIEQTAELPAFPVHCLGDIADYISACAESFSVPTAMPATAALATIAASVMGKAVVRPKRDWTEPLQLYIWAMAENGQLKSPIFKEVSSPIKDFEAELQEAKAPEIRQVKTQRAILEKKRAEAINAGDDEAFRIDEELAELPDGNFPRLLADNTTSEKLAHLMQQNSERIALFSAESEVIQNICGKYSQGRPDSVLHLKGWSSDSVVVDRLSREPINMRSPSLSMFLCIQPTVLQNLQHKQYFQEVGLLPRFLFAVCEGAGQGEFDSPDVPHTLRENWRYQLRRLLQWNPEEIIELKIEGQARDVFRDFFNDYRSRIENSEEALIGWRRKLRGQVLRIAAGLSLFHGESEIIPDYLIAAIEIAEWFEHHTKAAYGLLEVDEELKLSQRIVKFITGLQESFFTRRSLQQWIKNGKVTSSDLETPLMDLSERGYIRKISDRPETYAVNQALR
ncbi:YfjI family protein [Sedimentisphaera salicampi]|uniref:YfjI family protein n=1 Tax=Sedimentisphaera salicampi TaxID=1941349 RepID=UPI000B9C56ED|nr:YfjI family protein [Sedimentisphaera salicampi]OXU15728.1 hypothetical protein SMSP1_00515 [Sedimentisphaera salicampi]